MTIAITGQRKYEYQDLVCIYIALPFLSTLGFGLKVEPAGGEDAELSGTMGSFSGYIEVQVKGSEKPITLEVLSEWMAHFPAHGSSGCLLERLKDDSRAALFVCSGRVRDDLANLVVRNDWSGGTHEAACWSRDQAGRFLVSFGNQHPFTAGESRLNTERRLQCQKIRDDVSSDEIRAISSRILIIEQCTEDLLYDLCSQKLRKDYLVPAGLVRAVVWQLTDLIRSSKGTSEDVAATIKFVLNPFLNNGLTPGTYQQRGNEDTFLKTLWRDPMLLLTGVPRCGKTYTAKWIAGKFQKHGYHVRLGSDIEEADRFLLEPIAEERLFLLDDPLGSTYLAERPGEKLHMMRDLSSRLRNDRKLIITQRKDLLLESMGKSSIAGCTIGTNRWFDLGQPPTGFIQAVWVQLCAEGGVPEQIKNIVGDYLTSQGAMIEVGCLSHLAFSWQSLPETPSLEQVLHCAMEEAHEIAVSLIDHNPGMSDVLLALAISTTDNVAVHRSELAFVLSDKTCAPGLTESIGLAVSFGGTKKVVSFPKYDEEPHLAHHSMNALDYLERRRFVICDDGFFNFAVPFYRSVAEALIGNLTSGRFESIKGIVTRGLSCLGPKTTLNTIRNLSRIMNIADFDNQKNREVIDIATQALKSIFPATRDQAVLFLSDYIHKLADDEKKNIYSKLAAVPIDPDEVQWAEGIPWISPNRSYDFSDLFPPEVQSGAEIEPYLVALSDEKELGTVSPEYAMKAARYLFAFPDKATMHIALRLLNYDEAIIRAECAKAWLSKDHGEDGEVLDRVFEDRHPSVALAACEAVLNSWARYSQEKQEAIFARLSTMASSPIIATNLIHMMNVFDREERFEEGKPWDLWGRIFPFILQALPTQAAFDKAKFFNVIREASRKLSSEAMMSICSAWADWVIRELHDELPDDFALGIVDVLMKIAQTDISQRESIVLRLLRVNDTGATMVFCGDLVDYWDSLSDIERGSVAALLTSDRVDVLWLRAIAITRRDVPEKLQEILFGEPSFLDKSAADLIVQMPHDLLLTCVHVYCGRPQPLWYIGTHHRKNPTWQRIISQLPYTSSKELFELAVNELLKFSGDEEVAAVLRNIRTGREDDLFLLLLSQKVRCTGKWHGKVWVELLENPPIPRSLAEWMEKMAEVAPKVLNDIAELRLWIPDEKLQLRFLKEYLKTDYEVCVAAMIFREAVKSGTLSEVEAALKSIEQLYHTSPPRILGTHNRVQTALKDVKGKIYIPDTMTEFVESTRKKTIEEGQSIYERFRERYTELDCWLSLARKRN